MKLIRRTLAVLLIVGICLAIFRSEYLIQYGVVQLNWGWMSSYLFPKGLLLVLTSLFVWMVSNKLSPSGWFRFFSVLILFGISVGGYLLVNKPYIEWVKKGTDMTTELAGNPVEIYLGHNQPDFEGVVCLALPGCPHCEVAIPKLAMMQNRVPKLDVMVFIFTEDSLEVSSFRNDVGVHQFPFDIVPDADNSIELCRGRFPTFLYVRNGKVIHRWFSSEFGYPAFDWVENRLQ